MNMNPDQPDFEALRRLLKLKRYEKPTPRYFNDFSGQVINRIKAEKADAQDNLLSRLAGEWPWMQKILSAFQNKPVFAGALGVGVFALLVGGAIYDEKPGSFPTTLGFSGTLPQATAQAAPVFTDNSPFAINSTNAVTSLNGGSIFDAIKINTWPAGWSPGGN